MDVCEPATMGWFVFYETAVVIPSEEGLDDCHGQDGGSEKVIYMSMGLVR
jgi:hypothetical protein